MAQRNHFLKTRSLARGHAGPTTSPSTPSHINDTHGTIGSIDTRGTVDVFRAPPPPPRTLRTSPLPQNMY